MKKNQSKLLTRGEFLKLSSIGFISASSGSLSLANFLKNRLSLPIEKRSYSDHAKKSYGRTLYDLVHVFQKPSSNSAEVHTFKKDSILPIQNSVKDFDKPEDPPQWFEIKENAYIHSSNLQPVKINFNPVEKEISIYGALAEVSIPYTKAFPSTSFNQLAKFRFYYQSTHWIKRTIIDKKERAWYEIKDDKNPSDYIYVPANHLRILPEEEFNQISPEVPEDEKRIEVHLEGQFMIAYEYDKPIFSAKVSTGNFEKNYDTPKGTFNTHYKRYSQHLLADNLLFGGYDLPGVPWLSYINTDGIAFHGAYWHNDFGQSVSHGCINLRPVDAKWLYRWTSPKVPSIKQYIYNTDTSIGTRVDIL